MQIDLWHEDAIDQVTKTLSTDEDVKGLLLVGSCAQSDVQPDAWSDIDMAIVVDYKAMARFFPDIAWLARFGETYAFNQTENGIFGITRCRYIDGRLIDFIIVPESSLRTIDEWEFNPLCYGTRVLFSKSKMLDEMVTQTFPPPVCNTFSDAQLEKLTNDFWFKAMLAVTKTARNDLLIAVHLSLDMVRDCLLLGMALRDRAMSTNHHRDGSKGNHVVEALRNTVQPYTIAGTLDSIEESAIVFDKLASQWTSDYNEHRGPLLDWIARVRARLTEW